MKTKNIVLGGILAVIGFLMLIMPNACIKAVAILVGLTAIIIGGYNLFVVYKKSRTQTPEVRKIILIKAITSIVIGLIAVISPFALVKVLGSIWKIISYILAVYLILYAATIIYSAIKYRDVKSENLKKNIIEGIICILLSVILFVIPSEVIGKTFVRVLGVAGIIVGAVLILVEVLIEKRTTVITKEDVVIVDEETDESNDEQEDVQNSESDESKTESEPKSEAETESEINESND